MTELAAGSSALAAMDVLGSILDAVQPYVLAGITALLLVILCSLFGLCKTRSAG